MAGQNTKILASDYNAIQTIINGVMGTGTGDSGYGQTLSSSQISSTTTISVLQWTNLRSDILKARTHQTTSPETLTIPTTSVKISESDRAAYQAAANNAVTYRLAIPPSGQATSSVIATLTRTTAWNGSISHSVTVTFATTEAARFYFNAGGQIQFTASRTGGTVGTKNTSWTTMLTNMGTITFGRSTTSATGTGTGSSIGWSNLTTTAQTIFTKNTEQIASPSYTPNDYHITAATSANGLQLIFVIYFEDLSGQPNVPWGTDENVDGTLTSTATLYYATGTNVSVTAPTLVTNSGL